MRKTPRLILCLTFIALALTGGTARLNAGAQVDLELVLAVDVSRSMDFEEQKLQRDGYAAAFRHPEVLKAIRAGGLGRIAVIYMEWGGVGTERIAVPWTLIDGPESADGFAAAVEAAPIMPVSRTSVAAGLQFASTLFDKNEFDGIRRVIDISGDGANNQGEPVANVRDRVVAQGVTINGLPILLKAGTPSGWFDIKELDRYYEDCVIGGHGAFLIPVTEEIGFAKAVRRKLILEIALSQPRLIPAQAFAPTPPAREKTDCLIGEKLWRQRWEN